MGKACTRIKVVLCYSGCTCVTGNEKNPQYHGVNGNEENPCFGQTSQTETRGSTNTKNSQINTRKGLTFNTLTEAQYSEAVNNHDKHTHFKLCIFLSPESLLHFWGVCGVALEVPWTVRNSSD